MSSLVGACLFVVCLHFADVGKAVRRDFQTESVEVEEAVRRDLQTESVEGRETDLAHETLSSVEKTLVSKRGGGKPTKPKPTKPSPRASRDSGKPPNPATTTPSPTPSGNSTALGRRKLNVLVLHGTGQSGRDIEKVFAKRQCGVSKNCTSIANFYYPTGPHVVSRLHVYYLLREPFSRMNRNWYDMGIGFNFSRALFNGARRFIENFVNKEIPGPVDVICGYSQGAMAATQLLNDIFAGKIRNEKLQKVRGAIFLSTPAPRRFSGASVSRDVGKKVKSLHCNGNRDAVTPLRGARRHAAAFKDDTFYVYRGSHYALSSIGSVMRKFLLSLEGGSEI